MSTCYADPAPVFKPAMRLIAGITTANPAVVTTTFAHGYISGTIVRLDIPAADGMQQIDGFVGAINVTGSTTFQVNVDATNYTPFAIPVSPDPHVNTCAQVVPIGEVDSILDAAVRNVLPY